MKGPEKDAKAAAANPKAFARTDILGVGISAVNLELARDTVMDWVHNDRRDYVTVTGVHGVIEAQDDEAFKTILNDAGLTVPDGMPMVWLSWLNGFKQVDRVFGPDLMLALTEALAGEKRSAFYYGGQPGIAEELSQVLGARFPGLRCAGAWTPPFRALTAQEESEITQMINNSGADIVWVGLSTPKQERWMARFRSRLTAPALIAVGAAFDYHTDRISRAPRWMQRSGLEWFYRLCQDPKRLWQRYLRNNPLFAWYLLCQKLRLRSFEPR